MPKRIVCLNWEADWASRSIWQVLRQFINEPKSPDTYDHADTFATWIMFVMYRDPITFIGPEGPVH